MQKKEITLHRAPPKLPTTEEEYAELRRSKPKTVLQEVRDLWPWVQKANPEFDRYADAIQDKDAVEGSKDEDDGELARMFRKYARDEQSAIRAPATAAANLAELKKAVRNAPKEWGRSRLQRLAYATQEEEPQAAE